jgi:hypothetical protein
MSRVSEGVFNMLRLLSLFMSTRTRVTAVAAIAVAVTAILASIAAARSATAMHTVKLSANAVAVIRFELKGWRAKNKGSRLPA